MIVDFKIGQIRKLPGDRTSGTTGNRPSSRSLSLQMPSLPEDVANSKGTESYIDLDLTFNDVPIEVP